MNDTIGKTKHFPGSPTEATATNKIIDNLIDQAHQQIERCHHSVNSHTESDINQADFSSRTIKLKRTAEDINAIENLLTNRININQLFDRKAEKLVYQLNIQTNRLKVQLDEFDEETIALASDVKLDDITVS